MTENITLEITPALADSILDYTKKLADTFGIQGYGQGAPLWHLKAQIEKGQIVLTQKKEEEAAQAAAKAAKTQYKVVMCNVDKTATNHDCWILHKPSKTVYYAPFGHHHQIIQYLMNNFPGVINEDWYKSDEACPKIRTGDVKHGNPRTAKENPVTMKKLRAALIKAYYDARGQQIPPHMQNGGTF